MATTPDIAIGNHPTLGVVANNHSNLPAAKLLLNRLGFERGTDKGLYTLTASKQPAADRAAQAVAILRAARFNVETDLAYEPEPGTLRPAPSSRPTQQAKPEPAPAKPVPAQAEPDVAFGKHPTKGIVAAVSDNRPYAQMVLRVAGFQHDRDLDVYTLPARTDHAAASDIVRNVSQVLGATGSTVHVVPGALASKSTDALDGPSGPQALLEAVRRLIQAAAAWCLTRAGGAGAHLADRFTDAAQALGRVEVSLDNASERLRADRPAATTAEPTLGKTRPASTPDPATGNRFVEPLSPAADAVEIATALDRITDDTGALTAVHELVEKAALQCAELPGEMGTELSTQLREAARALDRVGGALIDVGDHLADMPQRSAAAIPTATSARAAAARSTTRKAPVAPTGQTPVVAHQTRTTSAQPGRTR